MKAPHYLAAIARRAQTALVPLSPAGTRATALLPALNTPARATERPEPPPTTSLPVATPAPSRASRFVHETVREIVVERSGPDAKVAPEPSLADHFPSFPPPVTAHPKPFSSSLPRHDATEPPAPLAAQIDPLRVIAESQPPVTKVEPEPASPQLATPKPEAHQVKDRPPRTLSEPARPDTAAPAIEARPSPPAQRTLQPSPHPHQNDAPRIGARHPDPVPASVHIGSIEIRITQPAQTPKPPVPPLPLSARPITAAPATPLSRGYQSLFGLRQG